MAVTVIKRRNGVGAEVSQQVAQTVSGILGDIRANGDEALSRYSAQFDKWSPESFRLSEAEIAERFSGKGAWKKRLPQLLETLVALGRARKFDNQRYGASR